MPLLFEIIAPDGTVTRVAPERGLARVPAQPGAVYRIVDESGASLGDGARVLRYENDLVVADLPGGDNFEIADFFSACTPEAPCQFSLAELGGAPGEMITPMSSPAAALTQGGFLMAAPGSPPQSLPQAPDSEFNWKPIAAIGGGLVVAGAGLGGGGGGGGEDPIPSAPALSTQISNDTTPVFRGTAQAGVQVTMTLTPGGTTQRVTYVTTADGNGQWTIDIGSQTPSAGTLPAGGLPANLTTSVDLLATSASGNQSSVTQASIMIDLTPPNATATLTAINDDTVPAVGAVSPNASSNDLSPQIVGTLDQALASGDRVEILRNGAVIGQATVNGLSWAFTDTPLGSATSTPGTTFAYSARVADAAGNTTAETPAQSITIDTEAPPAPTLNVVAGDDAILLAEATAGVAVSGTTIGNGTIDLTWGGVTRQVTADAAGTFSTTFLSAELPAADGQIAVSAIATDGAGNVSAAASRPIEIDRVPPGLTITSSAATPFNAAATLTFTFSEPVTGFDLGDVTLGGGVTAGTFTAVSPSVYTLQITPPASAVGTATATVAANVANDLVNGAAGNGNTGASFSQAYDTAPPTPTITDDIAAAETLGNVTFTIDFGEPVTGFAANELSITNGTLVSGPTGSGAVYTAVVAPPPNDTGTMTLSVLAGAVTDVAGNPNPLGSGSQGYNTDRPTVTIAPTAGGVITPPPNAAIQYTITFSEAVTGLTLGDILVINGADSNLAGSGAVYTFDATPTANLEANMVVTIAAGGVQDLGGNDNLAGSSAPQPIDTLAPTLTITDNTAGTATGPVLYTFSFSEAVTGFTAGDVTITNGTAGTLNGSGASYTMSITPNASSTADLLVSVAGAQVQDASGNTNAPASAAAQAVDTDIPNLVLTDNTPGIASAPIVFTFDFGESVTGFDQGDIGIVSSAGVSSFTIDSFTTLAAGQFELQVTPGEGEIGTLTINVADGVATDAAGNASTGVVNYTQDFSMPVVVFSLPDPGFFGVA
ncbi:MAG: Ig-like domain-containing protein [Burkholderiaceae bacterium]